MEHSPDAHQHPRQTPHCIDHWLAHSSSHCGTYPGWQARPIRPHPGFSRPTTEPFLAHDRRLSQGQRRQNRAVCEQWRCTSPAAGEQWRWHQCCLYQAQRQTASRQCSPSGGWRNLVPVPAASWLDLWVWNHRSYRGQGLHPCPNKDSRWSSPPSLLGSYHCWKQPLSVFLLAQLLPHPQLSASQPLYQKARRSCHISSCWVLCQTVSVRFAVLAVTPALVAAVVVTSNLRAGWNWLAVTVSRSLQVQIRGKKFAFLYTWVCAMKSHTTMWCCLTHSSFGMTFTLLTALLKLLGQSM